MNRVAQVSELKKIASPANGNRLLSFGVKTKVKDLISESTGTLEVGFIIDNDSDQDVHVAIGAIDANAEIGIKDKADILTALGADCFLMDGVVFTSNGDVTVTTTNAKHPVKEMIRYARNNPFRFSRLVMDSDAKGVKESSNYTGKIKTMFFSPFEDTIEDEFSLRSIVRDKFQDHRLELDFQLDTELNPIVGVDNFVVLTVKKGTTLTIQAGIGAQFSANQYLYRRTSQADKIMKPFRKRIGQ